MEILERLLRYPDGWFDDYHQTHYRATQMLTAFLRGFLDSIDEDELGSLFEKLRDLAGRDEYDIGIYDMLEAVAERKGIDLDPDDFLTG